MILVNTCGLTTYSQLIPAIKTIYTAPAGETFQVVMDDINAFRDLKEYLSEQGIGFREIYDGGGQMAVEFTIK